MVIYYLKEGETIIKESELAALRQALREAVELLTTVYPTSKFWGEGTKKPVFIEIEDFLNHPDIRALLEDK